MRHGGAVRLLDAYDLFILDLDGVLYLIEEPISAGVKAVGRLRADGRPLLYVTNNASRRATEVAGLLTELGMVARPEEVLTSAAAAAEVLAARFPAGAPVLVVGADALRTEVRAAGLEPVATADAAPVAVVQGYGRQVGWTDLAEAAVAVRNGALWVATNTDRTLPSPRGPLPGNGSLVAVLRTALGREPDLVVGKPEPALFHAAARRAGAARPLVVGDRLDTDMAGAIRAGMDSLLVLTGVSSPADLLVAAPEVRPTYVARDLHGLFEPDGVVRLPGPGTPVTDEDSGWRVEVDADSATLTGSGTTLAALGTLCAAAWSAADPFPAARVAAGSEPARLALSELGLG